MSRIGERVHNAIARRLSGTVVSVKTTQKLIALTFDDGPDPAATPKLLDLLARNDAKATFFMIGTQAEKHPDLVARVAAEGHEIGNHSWDHPALPLLARDEFDVQIDRTRATLAPHGQTLMRPPYGFQSVRSHWFARRQGYTPVCWSIHCEDWMDHDAGKLAGTMLEQLRPGAIILLHDNLYTYLEERYRDRRPVLDALEILMRSAPDYRFVTVSELMRAGKPMTRYWISEPEMEFLDDLRGGDPSAPTPAAPDEPSRLSA